MGVRFRMKGMATLTHTIQINQNPLLNAGMVRATRTSKTKRYGACVVATATQATVDDVAVGLADAQASFEKHRLEVSEMVARLGMSADAAEAIHTARVSPWYDLVFANERAIQGARKARTGRSYEPLTDADKQQARAQVIASGMPDPYTLPEYALSEAARNMRNAESRVQFYQKQNLQVGQQLVVTWCRDAGLALKAMQAHEAGHYRAKHFKLEVRTDIEVTSK